MFRRLDRQKKIGTVSVIIGFALLILTLVLIPLRTAGSFKYYLLIPAAVLILSELNCMLSLFRLPAAVVMIRSLPAGIPAQEQRIPVYVSPGRAP